jgi:hypothetical protein
VAVPVQRSDSSERDVHVAVLEEAETELLAQQTACGDVDAFLLADPGALRPGVRA